jgi:hypothetical protein
MKPACLCCASLFAIAPYLLIACSGSRPLPSEPPPRAPPREASAENTPEARLVFSNCYLGNFRFASAGYDESVGDGPRSSGASEPSCAINADCIAQQGVVTPGDGAVAMECERGNCSCHLEALAPPHTVAEFQFSATCSSPEVMQRLIREHCLAGMDVKSSSQVPDETPSRN